MIGQYDIPATYRYIDTAPLAEMNMVGQAYKDFYGEAQKNYQNYITANGNFYSPIASDVEGYDKETINRLQDKIKDINDPDWLKTAEGQAAINNIIATTNYAKLAKYKQSAENASEWLKAYQSLKAQGKINDAWLDTTPNNWSTDKNGIFNETSPLEYKSAAELTEPYVHDLKPSYLGDKWDHGAKYNIYGITNDSIMNTVAGHFNDLIQSPQGKKYYEQSVKTALQYNPTLSGNALDDAAKHIFNQTMATANNAKAVFDRKLDENFMLDKKFQQSWAMLKEKENQQEKLAELKKAGANGANALGGNGLTFSQNVDNDSMLTSTSNINNFANTLSNLVNNKNWTAQNWKLARKPIRYGNAQFTNIYNANREVNTLANAQKAYKQLYVQYEQSNSSAERMQIANRIKSYKQIIDSLYGKVDSAANAWALRKQTSDYLRANGTTANDTAQKGLFSKAAYNSINNNSGVSIGDSFYKVIRNDMGVDKKTSFAPAAGASYKSPETMYSSVVSGVTKVDHTRSSADGRVSLTKDIDTGELANVSGAMFQPSSRVVQHSGAEGPTTYMAGKLIIPIASAEKYLESLAYKHPIYGTKENRSWRRSHSLVGDEKEGKVSDNDAYDKLVKQVGADVHFEGNDGKKKAYITFPVYRKIYQPGTSTNSTNAAYAKMFSSKQSGEYYDEQELADDGQEDF